MVNKVVQSLDEALAELTSDMKLAVGGFGTCGIPAVLLEAITHTDISGLHTYSNNPGAQFADGRIHGIAQLLERNQLASFHGSFIGFNKIFEKAFLSGDVAVELIPQGTLAEKMRAGGAGIPAFFTPTGVGSQVADGGLPIRYDANGHVIESSLPKEVRTLPGPDGDREYVLEDAINADFALVRAYKADPDGNLVFRLAAQNFNMAAAMCGKVTVVEVEHMVESGELRPDEIHLPGIFVDRLLPLTPEQAQNKFVEAPPVNAAKKVIADIDTEPQLAGWSRAEIAARAARELRHGQYANLGIGLPTQVPDNLPEGIEVIFHSENGLLKTGPTASAEEIDPDLINAGKAPVTLRTGAATFASDLSFAMIRGGHVETTILGALQVSATGDIANWGIPGTKVTGMGGAMDLVQGAQRVIAVMEHVSKKGAPRLLKECTFPLTARAAVDLVITNLGVFDVTDVGLVLIELAPGVSEDDVRAATEASFTINLSHPDDSEVQE